MFHVQQLIDATSPTLFLPTNPAALRKALETGGGSVADGLRNLVADLREGRMTITDTGAFAPGKNLAITEGKVVYRNRLIELIQYAPLTKQTYAVCSFRRGSTSSTFSICSQRTVSSSLLRHGIWNI
jgi:polyhydroxyalkanoate synthase subunit PhaC